MRTVARSTLAAFHQRHPEAAAALARWEPVMKAAECTTPLQVQTLFPKAKVLNAERVRFEIQGGDYRLVAAFDFGRQIAFVKFIGTHADYDRIDALTVNLF